MIARLLKCCFILVISPHLRADSHNDLPWNIRKFAGGKLNTLGALETGLQHQDPWSKSSWSHTDLPRLREGRVGAQVTFVHWPLVIKDFHKLYGPGPKTRQQAYTHVKPHHSISSYNHVIWFIIELKLNAFAIWIANNGRIVRIRIECEPIRNGFTFYFYCWMSEEEWPSHAVTSFSWPCLAHGPKCIFIHLVSFSFFFFASSLPSAAGLTATTTVLGGLRPLRGSVLGCRQTNSGADRSYQANGWSILGLSSISCRCQR